MGLLDTEEGKFRSRRIESTVHKRQFADFLNLRKPAKGSRMTNRWMYHYVCLFLAATLLFPSFVSAQYQNNVMPGPGWQVIKAEWGSGGRWMDVTNRVRVMLTGNGMVKVNNANLGGDPAVGADKVLRIQARNSQGKSKQFIFKEGSSIDASQFYNYGGGGYPGGPGYPGNPNVPGNPGYPGGGYGNLEIKRAFYGLNNRTNDVTQLIRRMSQNGTLELKVTNNNLGGDPAPGADKVLTVIYRYQGRDQTATVKEGNTLRIP